MPKTNKKVNPLQDPLDSCLVALVDLRRGYSEDDLHKPLEQIVTEAKSALIESGLEDQGTWDLE